MAVDDDPDDLELIVRALRDPACGDNCDIVALSNGLEALDYLLGPGTSPGHASTPALVLLDLHMPKVGGIEVLRRMRADARTATVPVVVFTSSGSSEDRFESNRLGGNTYLLKPTDPVAFAAAVHSVYRDWVLPRHPPSR